MALGDTISFSRVMQASTVGFEVENKGKGGKKGKKGKKGFKKGFGQGPPGTTPPGSAAFYGYFNSKLERIFLTSNLSSSKKRFENYFLRISNIFFSNMFVAKSQEI